MKAVALFSGGLDSLLAIKLIQNQGIEIVPVTFKSYFFSSEKAERYGSLYGLEIHMIDFSDEHLNVVKKPVYGYGKNINPCIDCHALMIKKAGKYMEETGGRFLITGEVLGERPFSQSIDGLKKVDKLTGLGDITLRPLSAKLLPPTLPEREGWIDRDKLLGIRGRSRKTQLKLAEDFGIRVYDTPAGGCILTDDQFARRIKPFIHEIEPEGIFLFRICRHFRSGEMHLLISRNQFENEQLRNYGKNLIFAPDKKGPIGVLRKWSGEEDIIRAARIIARYCKPYGETKVVFDGKEYTVQPYTFQEAEKFLI